MRLLTVTIYSILAASIFAQYRGGYASSYGSASSDVFGGVGKSWNPEVPMAPPRVPATRPSFGYRPPPPLARRDVASEGKCNFDATKWRMEPQSAVANAIMFDRTTGISCEECLLKCTQIQAETTQWVCRTLTYDNRWKICDLFAINGTGYPFFLTDYSGRDYFVYLNARAANAAELSGDTEENARGNSVPGTSAPVYGAPSGAVENIAETKSEYEVTDLRASGSPDGAVYGSTAEGSGYEDAAAYSYGGESDIFHVRQPSATASNSLNYSAKSRKSKVRTSESSVKISKSHVETFAHHTQSRAQTSSSRVKQRTSSANEYQAQAVLSNAAGRTGVGLCHEGEVVRYVALNGKERANPGSETHFVDSNSAERCIEACDDDELITCESLVLTPSGCELSTTRASHADAEDLAPARNSTYFEKICVPSALAEGTEKIWPAIENYILVGHVLEVTDASSFAECLIACLRAEHDFGFICKSAMWYPVDDDQNCLLNSESRATQPDVFVAEDQGVQMLYFDIPRDESFIDSNMAHMRLRDEPLSGANSSLFTHWSSCNKNSTGMRHRYLKCKDRRDIRKCPKESVTCRGLPVKSLKFECIAVRDSLGRKRCPHGMQMLPDGQREYCKHPIDCH